MAQRWRLAPCKIPDSYGVLRLEADSRYPATLLLPPLLACACLLIVGFHHRTGAVIAVLCLVLYVMLSSLVYVLAVRRVTALLPEHPQDTILRLVHYVLWPVWLIEALRIGVAFSMFASDRSTIYVVFREVMPVRAWFSNPTDLLTVSAFAILALRLYFAVRQENRHCPGRILAANGLLLMLALALSYGVAGLAVFWAMGASPPPGG